MLDDMKKRGVTEESDSPWSSPVVLVGNKNGDLWFCVEYGRLNDVTQKGLLPVVKDRRHLG
jgi:hypothetical protein